MSSQKHSKEQVKLLHDFRVPASVTLQVVEELFIALDCPRSLTCYLLMKYKEYDQLVSLDVDPFHYNDATGFRDAYQATKFLSKNSFLELSVDREQVALQKFQEMELLCKQTNSRFRTPALDRLTNWSNVSLLNAMRQKIAGILGGCKFDALFQDANWGPGVTTLLKGSNVSATNKFQSETGITRDLFALVFEPIVPLKACLFDSYPLWKEHLDNIPGFPTFEVGNKIITVPKNSKTDRVIAVEPGINLWFQKGIGSFIRKRLRRHGIYLAYQSRNQQLARLGSEYPFYATVDFSSASDSISTALVRELLPPDWFSLLDACRSHFGSIKAGPYTKHEKFSSMGNGFTFELESLIFFAAASVICESKGFSSSMVSVYGDDVILPTECFESFSLFSEYLGFKVNSQKSFSGSYFRESCGSYYFNGVDVKPIFIKEMVQTPLQVFRLANAIRKMARIRNCYFGCDKSFRKCWDILTHSIPKLIRLKIDISLGDGGFISNFDEATPSRAHDSTKPKFLWNEGYFVRHAVETGLLRSSEGIGLLLDRLRSPSSQERNNNYTLRGRTKLLLSRSLVARWTDLGPWL